MFIQGLIIALFTALAGIVVYLVILVAHIVLKLIKEQLNLKIKFEPEKKEPE